MCCSASGCSLCWSGTARSPAWRRCRPCGRRHQAGQQHRQSGEAGRPQTRPGERAARGSTHAGLAPTWDVADALAARDGTTHHARALGVKQAQVHEVGAVDLAERREHHEARAHGCGDLARPGDAVAAHLLPIALERQGVAHVALREHVEERTRRELDDQALEQACAAPRGSLTPSLLRSRATSFTTLALALSLAVADDATSASVQKHTPHQKASVVVIPGERRSAGPDTSSTFDRTSRRSHARTTLVARAWCLRCGGPPLASFVLGNGSTPRHPMT